MVIGKGLFLLCQFLARSTWRINICISKMRTQNNLFLKYLIVSFLDCCVISVVPCTTMFAYIKCLNATAVTMSLLLPAPRHVSHSFAASLRHLHHSLKILYILLFKCMCLYFTVFVYNSTLFFLSLLQQHMSFSQIFSSKHTSSIVIHFYIDLKYHILLTIYMYNFNFRR